MVSVRYWEMDEVWIRAQVGEGIAAGVVVVAVPAEKGAEVEDRVVADDVGVGGRDVDRCRSWSAGRCCRRCRRWGWRWLPSADHVLHVQVVVGVGRLEPGAAVVQVEVDGVGLREAVVDAIEDILLVALVVEDGELGRIEEAAGVEAVDLDEVAPASCRRRRDRSRRSPSRRMP